MEENSKSKNIAAGKLLVEEYIRSGLSAKKYAQQENISYHKLMYWKKRINKLSSDNKKPEKVKFAALHIPTPTIQKSREIILRTEHYEIQIPAEISKETLENIFGALNKTCLK
ncbi:MAG: hypothetical protein WCY37_05855 [Candidatus Dojkabacteria bacterium]